MENEMVLPTAVRERGLELKALREKQAANFAALGRARTAAERAAVKAQCQATIGEIEVKARIFEEDLEMVRGEQANRQALAALFEARDAPAAETVKHEYKILKNPNDGIEEDDLNALAADGWRVKSAAFDGDWTGSQLWAVLLERAAVPQ